MTNAALLRTVLVNLLAAYLILGAPWLGYFWYRRARKREQAGDTLARVRLYRELVLEQVVTAGLICSLCFLGIPATRLGLGAPHSWWITAVLASVIVLLLTQSALRARPKAARLREKLRKSVGVLLPETVPEQRWFALVSLGAGISEEVAFRGFLFYFLGLVLPNTNALEKVLLTSLFFGIAHFYQGWQGVAKTGLVGLIFAGFYVLTGSVLLPIVLHAMVDMQVPIIFWPGKRSSAADPEAHIEEPLAS